MLKFLHQGFFKCFSSDKGHKAKSQDPKYIEIDHKQFDFSFSADNSEFDCNKSKSSTSLSGKN